MEKHSHIIDNIENTYISTSGVHGNGLFSKTELGTGQTLAILDGQRVPWSFITDIVRDAEWNALSVSTALYRPFKTKYFYINHSRIPNLELVSDELTGLYLRTLRDVRPDEELFLDYRRETLPDWYTTEHGASYL